MKRALPTVEITLPLELTLREETLLDMHSVLNVCNVILYELYSLEMAVDSSEELEATRREVGRVARSLSDPQDAAEAVGNIDSLIESITRAVDSNVARKPGSESRAEVIESRANLESIFDILRVRAREITARSASPYAWVTHEIEELRNNFLHVFRAIEKNSKGGYRIVYNLAQHEDQDYYVNLQMSSENGKNVTMPAVFQDVMRDLIANARKYTDPGGRIEAALYEGGGELAFLVEDTGRGIDPEEITSLVGFGSRGTNVADRPTRGGGFGLTKAYYVTRKFNGRMWVASELGEGTRIELRLPLHG